MSTCRAKKLAVEGHSSHNDASIQARFQNWLDDKFTKQDEHIKQQIEIIKYMIVQAKNSLMCENELKFSSLKNEIVEQAKNEIRNQT